MVKEKKEKKRKRLTGFGKGLIVIFALLLVLTVTALMLIQQNLGVFTSEKDIWETITPMKGTEGKIAKEFESVKRVNVLVLGIHEPLTDTMMVASFDMDNKKVDVISVPRDTRYERKAEDPNQGVAFQKINSQYGSGWDGEAFKGGPTASALAVSEVLHGMPIHYYVALTDDAIRAIVDAMGGVKLDVPMDMYYTDAKNGLYIDLKKGYQTLDGDKAVQYLRFRKGYVEGDYGRIKAQQKFVKEVFKQSIGFGFPKVAKTVAERVVRNISVKMATSIGSKAIGMTAGGIKTKTIPGHSEMIDGGSFYLHDPDKTYKLIKKLYQRSLNETAEREEKIKKEGGLFSCVGKDF